MRRLLGLLALLLAALLATLAGCGSAATTAPGATSLGTDPVSGLPWVAASSLPAQAQTVIQEIHNGGTFAHPAKDGSTFGNYEGLLPKESSGYYKEYTVDTPGASTRGTRRIVAGKKGELYYTGDHYESFRRIKE
jgi:ribonuclease T1